MVLRSRLNISCSRLIKVVRNIIVPVLLTGLHMILILWNYIRIALFHESSSLWCLLVQIVIFQVVYIQKRDFVGLLRIHYHFFYRRSTIQLVNIGLEVRVVLQVVKFKLSIIIILNFLFLLVNDLLLIRLTIRILFQISSYLLIRRHVFL